MRPFADKTGQQWNIEITFGTVLRVRQASSGLFDLLKPDKRGDYGDMDGVPLQIAIGFDFVAMYKLLALLLEPQLKAANVTDGEFAERLDGPRILAVQSAFLEEWRDFFLSVQRHEFAMALDKMMTWLKTGREKMAAAIAQLDLTAADEEVMAAMDKAMLGLTSSTTSGAWEESAELIRGT